MAWAVADTLSLKLASAVCVPQVVRGGDPFRPAARASDPQVGRYRQRVAVYRSRRKGTLLASGLILSHCGRADLPCLSVLSSPPTQVLQLRISIHPLSDDGNLLDCAVMATMAGLRGFRRWEWEVTGGEVKMVRFLLLYPTPSSPSPRQNQYRKKADLDGCATLF